MCRDQSRGVNDEVHSGKNLINCRGILFVFEAVIIRFVYHSGRSKQKTTDFVEEVMNHSGSVSNIERSKERSY